MKNDSNYDSGGNDSPNDTRKRNRMFSLKGLHSPMTQGPSMGVGNDIEVDNAQPYNDQDLLGVLGDQKTPQKTSPILSPQVSPALPIPIQNIDSPHSAPNSPVAASPPSQKRINSESKLGKLKNHVEQVKQSNQQLHKNQHVPSSPLDDDKKKVRRSISVAAFEMLKRNINSIANEVQRKKSWHESAPKHAFASAPVGSFHNVVPESVSELHEQVRCCY